MTTYPQPIRISARRIPWLGRSQLLVTHRSDPVLVLAAALVVLFAVAALFPAVLQTDDPLAQHLSNANEGPSASHWFGTDRLGRDVFSRAVAASRPSLLMGFVPVLIAVVGGGVIGLVAGYWQRFGDLTIMRVMDMMMAFPALILTLMIVAALGARSDTSGRVAMIAIGIAFIPGFARMMRSSVLATKEQLFVESARSSGASDLRIMCRHIVPNAVNPLIVLATLSIGSAILAGASLSFIGMATAPPAIDWGTMISDGRQNLSTAWWISTFPGLAMMLAAVAINVLGDALRDRLDPRLSRR